LTSVETVTVLITDLVGSTSLASRLGPTAADELRHEHFSMLREAIEGCSGAEVKNTGDGVVAVFQGAADAVSCAVSIQQRMERRNRTADEELAIRVGVALGDATHEEDDYFGMPVIEAARLCARAAGGQILTTQLVRMIGARDPHPFNAVGALELQGIPEPVAAYEIGWEPTGGPSEVVPVPSRLRGVPSVGYVGRLSEQERVTAAWDAALDGQRQVLLVSGEPGIGKTRFAAHTALTLHADGALVLSGHCTEEFSAPYGAWIEALSHFVEHAPDELLDEHVERHGGELARLVPALEGRVSQVPQPTQTDPETERYLLFSAVLGLLQQASDESPIVLLLDDLHWADRPTLALLKHAVAEADGQQLLLLGTYRDSDLSRDHPLTAVLADLRREEGIERLALRGLHEDDVISIMEAVAGHEMDAAGRELAREITAETDGNPFFVGEMLRHLSESQAMVQATGGRWRLTLQLEELGLPQSVREVIGRRVERLGEDCREVLSCAAIIGRDFDLELLVTVADKSEDDLIDVLDAAVEASLLEERSERTGSFSFAHNLINHTLYDELGVTRRSRLHRRVAEALEELCGDDPDSRVAELARHWSAATSPVDAERALTYSRRAGEQALAELAPDEATQWFAQALELCEKAPDSRHTERCELMIGLGEAQRQAGQPEFRETLLHAGRLAEDLHDADRMARAALANNRGFASAFGIVDKQRVAALERAIEVDPASDEARSARLLSLHAMELQFDPDYERRRALADEALALAREAGDDRHLPYVLRDHFHAVWAADTLETRRRTAEEMTALTEGTDDPLARIWALDRAVHAAAESGAMGDAAETLARLQALTEQLGQPGLRWHATYYAAGLALQRGDLEDANRLSEAATRLGEQAGEPDALLIHICQVFAVKAEQGLAEEIVDPLTQATAANPGIPAFEAATAVALCDLGRHDEAAPRLERAADQRFADVPRDQVFSTALTLWARVAAEVESEEAAAPLYDLIEPWRDRLVWNGATGHGYAESYLGMLAATLGSHERAGEHFAAASRIHQREGLRGWEARNLACWARSLLASGAVENARDHANRALALAREGGYGSSAQQAEELLRVATTS
jgi:class 3 adenylate cyclase